jgi:hypothetical protein
MELKFETHILKNVIKSDIEFEYSALIFNADDFSTNDEFISFSVSEFKLFALPNNKVIHTTVYNRTNQALFYIIVQGNLDFIKINHKLIPLDYKIRLLNYITYGFTKKASIDAVAMHLMKFMPKDENFNNETPNDGYRL